MKLRPASDGGTGRCAQLGIQVGDVVLQVNDQDIGACAAASGSSHFVTACRLLREASFPLEVIKKVTFRVDIPFSPLR